MELAYFSGSNGEKTTRIRDSYLVDGVYYDFYKFSREQGNRMMEMLESVDFRPRSSTESAIINIIMEETESFYNGDKSIEAVMEVIQNRISLLVHEGQ